jgi:SOS-response transcriptional repressor LexA
MMGITKRQSVLLEFVHAHFASHGVSPNYDEIAITMGWKSRGAAAHAVKALAARGLITVTPYIARGIKLVQPEGHNATNCFCDRCNAMRVRTAQTFIQALHVPSKILTGSNFKALGRLDRVSWNIGFPKPAHPETRKPKAKMQPAEIGIA